MTYKKHSPYRARSKRVNSGIIHTTLGGTFAATFKISAMAALVAGLTGCGGSWTNWFETETVTPQVLVAPNSAKQLTDYIGQATTKGARVRMTGNGHSMSDVAITNDVLFTPEQLNQPLTLDRSRLKNPNDSGLVRVESGIKVADLNTYLDQHGRALFNMGGYDGQTLAGVMMTATHGSGLAYGPIADQAASIQMVVDGGRMVQLEPANGITNPMTFSGKLEEDPTISVQLIQDDDAFNAAKVSIGSMGVVYAVTLNTDQKFWVREVRREIKWSALKKPGGYLDRITHGLPVYADQPSPEHWELQYSPYFDTNGDGDHTFLITEHYRSYTPLPEQASSERGQPGIDATSGLLPLLGQPLAVGLDLFPELSKNVLEVILNGEVDDNYTNVSYKVFNIGAVNDTPAVAIETAFTLDQTIAAIERSFTVADAQLAKGIPQTGPMAIRFVKQSSGLLATQQGHDTMFMEIIELRGGKNAMNLLKAHRQAYTQDFNARPHWGLDVNSITSEAQLRALYPDTWDRWKAQYRRFNVTGTFDGKATDRMGISVRPR
jgi:hypothetical protein